MAESDLAAAIDRLHLDVNRIAQGLTMMAEIQQRHGEMLADILDLVTVEPSDEEASPLAQTLKQLIAAVERLPEEIKRAVIERMAAH